MRYKYIIAGIIALGVIGVAVHHHKPPKPVNSVCHINGLLPDPACTPGSTYIAVNQNNIKQTICVTGWTSTVRPPQSYTEPLKKQSIKDYGYTDTNLAHYEEDHLIPLELGGNPTDPGNLWAEPGASPNAKDKVEGTLRSEVCSGKLSLIDAQNRIKTNWSTALK